MVLTILLIDGLEDAAVGAIADSFCASILFHDLTLNYNC